MEIVFKNLPAMPRNQATFIANNRQVLTNLARSFKKDVEHRLKSYDGEKKIFLEAYSTWDKKKGIIFSMYIYIPKDKLYTKDGRISMRSTDWDCNKCLVDCVSTYMGIDDSQTVDAHIYKRPSEDENWNYTITLN